MLKSFTFVKAVELNELIDGVKQTFAREFFGGDERIAADVLLEKQGVEVDW